VHGVGWLVVTVCLGGVAEMILMQDVCQSNPMMQQVVYMPGNPVCASLGEQDASAACAKQLDLCCAVLCCAVLCCAVLCCAVLCFAVLCCAVLCCAVWSTAGWHVLHTQHITHRCCSCMQDSHHPLHVQLHGSHAEL
jgi:hypothetical protein